MEIRAYIFMITIRSLLAHTNQKPARTLQNWIREGTHVLPCETCPVPFARHILTEVPSRIEFYCIFLSRTLKGEGREVIKNRKVAVELDSRIG